LPCIIETSILASKDEVGNQVINKDEKKEDAKESMNDYSEMFKKFGRAIKPRMDCVSNLRE
jgi:hypothetical protein